MKKVGATRLMRFDAAHRVVGHENKCRVIHGHGYTVEVEAVGDLDVLGRVVDFGVLKALVGGWLDRNWDHVAIVWQGDAALLSALAGARQSVAVVPFNPTAENMADYLLTEIAPMVLMDTGVVARRVRVWETPNCYGEATL